MPDFQALGELISITGGGTPSKAMATFYKGSIPWVTPKDMKSSDISSAQENITEEAVANSAAKIVEPNSVLVVVRSGVLKHTLPLAINRVPVAINQDMKALKCGPKLDPRYLFHYLGANSRLLLDKVRATTADNFPIDVLRKLSIPLPPLPEQRRIAAILDQADALRAKRRASIAKLDCLAQSIFLDMFGDPVANPKGWPDNLRLTDVADVVSGVTIGRRLHSKEIRPVPYMAVVNIQDRHLNLSIIKFTEATEDEIHRYELKKNDLLLTEGGDPDKLGRATLWNDAIVPCIHQNHVFRVRITSQSVNPHFLNWLVGSSRGKTYFLRSAKQTTGIASINMNQLRNFPLLLPPLHVQISFEKKLAAIATLYDAHGRSMQDLEIGIKSLQHSFFGGHRRRLIAAHKAGS